MCTTQHNTKIKFLKAYTVIPLSDDYLQSLALLDDSVLSTLSSSESIWNIYKQYPLDTFKPNIVWKSSFEAQRILYS